MVSFREATVADFAECRGDVDAIRFLLDKMMGEKDALRDVSSRKMKAAIEAAEEIINNN